MKIFLLTLSVFLSFPPFAISYPDEFKAAVVQIYRHDDGIGTGFILKIEPATKKVYLLTAAHVVGSDSEVQVEFFGRQGRENRLVGTVVKRPDFTRPKAEQPDLALILVHGVDFTENLMQLALSSESHIVGGESADVIATPPNGVPWSVIKLSIEAERSGKLYFAGNVGFGVSGAPILIADQAIGLVVTGPNPLGAPGEGVSAGEIATFVRGTIDPVFATVLSPPPRPGKSNEDVPRRTTEPNRAAKEAAIRFLELINQDRLHVAYDSLFSISKKYFSEATFVTSYTQYASGSAGGTKVRELVDSTEMLSIPNFQQSVTGDTYVLTFKTVFLAHPDFDVFEIVTVYKTSEEWKVVNFAYNPQKRD